MVAEFTAVGATAAMFPRVPTRLSELPRRTQADRLARAIVELGNAAGVNRGVELPFQSVIIDNAGKAQELAIALSGTSPVLTGRLAASWLNGEGVVRDNGDGTYTLDSRVPYARINDLGGDTGKGHKTHISPSFYVAAAAARVGLPPSAVRWVDGVLTGATGIGERGEDVSAGAAALGRMAV